MSADPFEGVALDLPENPDKSPPGDLSGAADPFEGVEYDAPEAPAPVESPRPRVLPPDLEARKFAGTRADPLGPGPPAGVPLPPDSLPLELRLEAASQTPGPLAVRALDLADRAGVDAGLAARQPEGLARLLRLQAAARGELRDSRVLTDAMADPVAGAAVLGQLEEWLALRRSMGTAPVALGDRFAIGQRNVELGSLAYARVLGGASPEQEAEWERLKAIAPPVGERFVRPSEVLPWLDPAQDAALEMLADSLEQPAPERAANPLGAAAEQAPNLIESMKGAGVGGTVGALVGGTVGLALGAPGGPGPAVAGALQFGRLGLQAGAAAGVAETSFRLNLGESLSQFEDLKTDDGQPLDPRAARGAAVLTAAAKAGLDFVSLTAMFALFPGGRALFQGPLSAVKERLVKAVGDRAVAAALTRFGASLAVAAGTEATTEGLQTILDLAAGETTRALASGEDDPLEVAARAAEAIEKGRSEVKLSFEEAGLATLVFGVAGGLTTATTHAGGKLIREAALGQAEDARIQRIERAALALDAMRQEAPVAFRRMAQALGEERGIESVVMDPAQLTTLFHEKEADPKVLSPEAQAELIKAAQEGRDALIPVGDYLAHVAPLIEGAAAEPERAGGAPGEPVTRPRTVLSPRALAPAETHEALAELRLDLEALTAAENLPGRVALPEAVEQTFRRLEATLVASGRFSAAEAGVYVGVMRAQLVAEASRPRRAGEAPLSIEDVLIRSPLPSFVGPRGEVPLERPELADAPLRDLIRERRLAEITRAVAELRTGPPPTRGRRAKYPVLNILRRRGGVDPDSALAGELRNMGVTNRSMPRLFRRGGMGWPDSIIGSEEPLLATLPRSGISTAEVGADYIDPQAILDAVRAELAGNPIRAEEETEAAREADEARDELLRLVDAEGINLAELTDEQAAGAILNAEMRMLEELFQGGQRLVAEGGALYLGTPGPQPEGAAEAQVELYEAVAEPTKPAEAARRAISAADAVAAAGRVGLAKVGVLRSGITRVRNAGDVAHLTAPLRKDAQEQALVVVTSKGGSVLRVISTSRGTATASLVHPVLMLGPAFDTPGAAKVWFVHNHPSGQPDPSVEDRQVLTRLARVLADSGLELAGAVNIAPGGRAVSYQSPEVALEPVVEFQIKPKVRDRAVDVLARRFVRAPGAAALAVRNPGTMADVIATFGDSGLTFLDGRHNLVGFLPLSIDEMLRLRGRGLGQGVARAVAEAHRTAAAAAVLVLPTGLTRQEANAAIENMQAFSEVAGISLLDAVTLDPNTGLVFSERAEGRDFGRAERATFRQPKRPDPEEQASLFGELPAVSRAEARETLEAEAKARGSAAPATEAARQAKLGMGDFVTTSQYPGVWRVSLAPRKTGAVVLEGDASRPQWIVWLERPAAGGGFESRVVELGSVTPAERPADWPADPNTDLDFSGIPDEAWEAKAEPTEEPSADELRRALAAATPVPGEPEAEPDADLEPIPEEFEEPTADEMEAALAEALPAEPLATQDERDAARMAVAEWVMDRFFEFEGLAKPKRTKRGAGAGELRVTASGRPQFFARPKREALVAKYAGKGALPIAPSEYVDLDPGAWVWVRKGRGLAVRRTRGRPFQVSDGRWRVSVWWYQPGHAMGPNVAQTVDLEDVFAYAEPIASWPTEETVLRGFEDEEAYVERVNAEDAALEELGELEEELDALLAVRREETISLDAYPGGRDAAAEGRAPGPLSREATALLADLMQHPDGGHIAYYLRRYRGPEQQAERAAEIEKLRAAAEELERAGLTVLDREPDLEAADPGQMGVRLSERARAMRAEQPSLGLGEPGGEMAAELLGLDELPDDRTAAERAEDEANARQARVEAANAYLATTKPGEVLRWLAGMKVAGPWRGMRLHSLQKFPTELLERALASLAEMGMVTRELPAEAIDERFDTLWALTEEGREAAKVEPPAEQQTRRRARRLLARPEGRLLLRILAAPIGQPVSFYYPARAVGRDGAAARARIDAQIAALERAGWVFTAPTSTGRLKVNRVYSTEQAEKLRRRQTLEEPETDPEGGGQQTLFQRRYRRTPGRTTLYQPRQVDLFTGQGELSVWDRHLLGSLENRGQTTLAAFLAEYGYGPNATPAERIKEARERERMIAAIEDFARDGLVKLTGHEWSGDPLARVVTVTPAGSEAVRTGRRKPPTPESGQQTLFQPGRAEEPTQPERIAGSIGADKARLIELLGATMYNKPILEVATKELLQNAFDAVKGALHLGQVEPAVVREDGSYAPSEARIEVIAYPADRVLEVRDNGVGMTTGTLQSALFTIGGTDKPALPADQRSGGLGLAKMAFLFGSEWVEVDTVRDGWRTHVRATSAELQSDAFTIERSRAEAGVPNGTTVRVAIPTHYTSPTGDRVALRFEAYDVRYVLDLLALTAPIHVLYRELGPEGSAKDGRGRKEIAVRRPLVGVRWRVPGSRPFTRVRFDWGWADVFVDDDLQSSEIHSVTVLSAGLWQFTHYVEGLATRRRVTLDVHTSVEPTDPRYPFDNHRQGFRRTIQPDLNALASYLSRWSRAEQAAATSRQFERAILMPRAPRLMEPDAALAAEAEAAFAAGPAGLPMREVERPAFEELTPAQLHTRDPSGGERQVAASATFERPADDLRAFFGTSAFDTRRPIFHNNTTARYDDLPGAAAFFAEVGTVVAEFVERVGQDYARYGELTAPARPYASGVSIDQSYRGVHIRVPFPAVFLNPLGFRAQNPRGAAAGATLALVHEVVHTAASGHNESFVAMLHDEFEKFWDDGLYDEFQLVMETVYERHWEVFRALRERYESLDTAVAGPSLEGEAARSGGREGREPSGDARDRAELEAVRRGAGRDGARDRRGARDARGAGGGAGAQSARAVIGAALEGPTTTLRQPERPGPRTHRFVTGEGVEFVWTEGEEVVRRRAPGQDWEEIEHETPGDAEGDFLERQAGVAAAPDQVEWLPPLLSEPMAYGTAERVVRGLEQEPPEGLELVPETSEGGRRARVRVPAYQWGPFQAHMRTLGFSEGTVEGILASFGFDVVEGPPPGEASMEQLEAEGYNAAPDEGADFEGALDRMAAILSGQEWNADTLEALSSVIGPELGAWQGQESEAFDVLLRASDLIEAGDDDALPRIAEMLRGVGREVGDVPEALGTPAPGVPQLDEEQSQRVLAAIFSGLEVYDGEPAMFRWLSAEEADAWNDLILGGSLADAAPSAFVTVEGERGRLVVRAAEFEALRRNVIDDWPEGVLRAEDQAVVDQGGAPALNVWVRFLGGFERSERLVLRPDDEPGERIIGPEEAGLGARQVVAGAPPTPAAAMTPAQVEAERQRILAPAVRPVFYQGTAVPTAHRDSAPEELFARRAGARLEAERSRDLDAIEAVSRAEQRWASAVVDEAVWMVAEELRRGSPPRSALVAALEVSDHLGSRARSAVYQAFWSEVSAEIASMLPTDFSVRGGPETLRHPSRPPPPGRAGRGAQIVRREAENAAILGIEDNRFQLGVWRTALARMKATIRTTEAWVKANVRVRTVAEVRRRLLPIVESDRGHVAVGDRLPDSHWTREADEEMNLPLSEQRRPWVEMERRIMALSRFTEDEPGAFWNGYMDERTGEVLLDWVTVREALRDAERGYRRRDRSTQSRDDETLYHPAPREPRPRLKSVGEARLRAYLESETHPVLERMFEQWVARSPAAEETSWVRDVRRQRGGSAAWRAAAIHALVRADRSWGDVEPIVRQRLGKWETREARGAGQDAALWREAERVFGTTDDPLEAGYLGPDGTLLDFSGKREGGTPGMRAYDHRQLGEISDEFGITGDTDGMLEFMRRTGAVRVSFFSGGFAQAHAAGPITPAQARTLARLVRRGRFDGLVLERTEDNEDTALELEAHEVVAERILSFFETGEDTLGTSDYRGSITFDPTLTRVTIAFTQSRDLSTLLHELGHLYTLRLIRDAAEPGAAEWLVRDAEALLRFAGFSGPIDDLRTDEGAELFSEEMKEKLARAFEAYLRDGKAPSQELRGAFARMREWLSMLYRSIRELIGAEALPDDVRAVFDRLLATDEQIEAARAEEDVIGSIFASDALTDAERARIRSAMEGLDQGTREELDRRQLRAMAHARGVFTKVAAEREAARARELEAIRETVRAELEAMPVWQADHYLRTGTFLGRETPEGTARVKLSRPALYELFHPESEAGRAIAAVPTGARSWLTADPKKGVHPDGLAELFGFETGADLVRALLAAGSREAGSFDRVLEAEAHRRWRDAGLVPPGELEEAAIRALAGERRIDFLLLEDELLSARTGERAVSRNLIEQTARRAIDAKSVRELRPDLHASTRKKARRAAMKAAAKGDFRTAAAQLRRELLHTFMEEMARDARSEATEIVREARRFERDPKVRKRIGLAGKGYLEQLDGVLEDVEIRVVSFREMARRKLTLVEWVMQREGAGDSIVLPDWAREANRRHWRSLSMTELRGLQALLHSIDTAARRELAMKLGEERVERAEVRSNILREIDEGLLRPATYSRGVTPRAASLANLRRALVGRDPNALGDLLFAGFRRLDAELVGKEGLVSALTQSDPTSYLFKALIAPFAAAEVKHADRMQSFVIPVRLLVETFLDRHGRAKYDAPLDEKRLLIPARFPNGGQPFELTLRDLIGIALNIGNQGNLDKLLGGFDWDEETVRRVLEDHLGREDWELVQGVWKLTDSLREEVFAFEERMSGVRPERVEAIPFEVRLPDGSTMQLEGGYFPVVYDPTRSLPGALREAAEVLKHRPEGFGRIETSHPFTKKRTGLVSRALKIDGFAVLLDHLEDVSLDLAYREPLIDAYKLLYDEDFDAELRKRLGHEFSVSQYWLPWLQAMAGDTGNPRGLRSLERLARGARIKASLYVLLARPTTLAIQPTGLANGWQQLTEASGKKVGTGARHWEGARYLIDGLWQSVGRGDLAEGWRIRQDVLAKSGLLRHRLEAFDREFKELTRRLEGRTGWTAALTLFWAKTLAGVQLHAVDMPIWLAAYRQARDQGRSEGDAVLHADSTVKLSQGSGSLTAQAAILVQSPEVVRAGTLFMTYPSMVFNQVRNSWRRHHSVPATAAAVAVAMTWPTILGFGIRQVIYLAMNAVVPGSAPEPPGDDDDELMRRIARELGQGTLGTIPFVSDVWRTFALGDPLDAPGAYGVWGDVLEDVGDAFWYGERRGEWDRMLWATLRALALTRGLPADWLLSTGSRASREPETGRFRGGSSTRGQSRRGG